MSVPAYNRSTSKVEFLRVARELLYKTIAICSKAPQDFRFYGLTTFYNKAESIMDNLIMGNSTDLNTRYVERTQYFNIAIDLLNAYSNQLNILADYKKKDKYVFTDKDLNYLGKHIYDLRALMTGVIKKDKERKGV